MVMGDKQPEHVTSEYHLNEFGTDDLQHGSAPISGRFQGGGYRLHRHGYAKGSSRVRIRGSIYLPDYQKAERLIIRPMKGRNMSWIFL